MGYCGGSTLFIRWQCLRLKRVCLDQEALYVSNYVVERRIPLTEVSRVWQPGVIGGAVVVEFHTLTAFGRRIVFMPSRLLGPHPIGEELRRLAHLTS